MRNVTSSTGEEVIDTKNLVTFTKESFAQVGSEKTGPTGNEYFFGIPITH